MNLTISQMFVSERFCRIDRTASSDPVRLGKLRESVKGKSVGFPLDRIQSPVSFSINTEGNELNASEMRLVIRTFAALITEYLEHCITGLIYDRTRRVTTGGT